MRGSTELVAILFQKCAHYVDLMGKNIQQKEYYERYLNGEKVTLMLTQLMASLDEENPQTKNFSEELRRFCYLMMSYITEINQKERFDLCLKTSNLLREMGDIWHNVKKSTS